MSFISLTFFKGFVCRGLLLGFSFMSWWQICFLLFYFGFLPLLLRFLLPCVSFPGLYLFHSARASPTVWVLCITYSSGFHSVFCCFVSFILREYISFAILMSFFLTVLFLSLCGLSCLSLVSHFQYYLIVLQCRIYCFCLLRSFTFLYCVYLSFFSTVTLFSLEFLYLLLFSAVLVLSFLLVLFLISLGLVFFSLIFILVRFCFFGITFCFSYYIFLFFFYLFFAVLFSFEFSLYFSLFTQLSLCFRCSFDVLRSLFCLFPFVFVSFFGLISILVPF